MTELSKATATLSESAEQEKTGEVLETIKILQERKAGGYERGSRSDGNYVALALGPGGWAGLNSFAMAAELDRAGLLDYTDMFVGNSIGAVQALYAATKQFKDCRDGVIDVMVPAGPFPQMETLEKVIFKKHPLDFDKLPKDLPIVIGVTTLDKFGTKLIYSDEVEPVEMARWAVRACHMPWLGGPPPEVGGQLYSDTGLAKPNTIELAKQINQEAVATGDNDRVITHLLSLENLLPTKPTRANKALAVLFNRPVDAFIKHYDPDANPDDVFRASISGGQFSDLRTYKTEFESKLTGNDFRVGDGAGHEINVERVYPMDVKDLPRLFTREVRRLVKGWDAGRVSMLGILYPGLDLEKAGRQQRTQSAKYRVGEVGYSITGEQNGKHNPIVLVNGFSRGRLGMSRLADTLAAKGERQVVTSDQPHTNSLLNPINNQAEALLTVLRDSGLAEQPVDFVAHSFGSLILARAAQIAKDRGLDMTPFDSAKGSHSILLAPSGSIKGENPAKLGKRFKAHIDQAKAEGRRGLYPEVDDEGRGNLKAYPLKSLSEGVALGSVKMPYAKLGKLGLKPTVLGYHNDTLFPENLTGPVLMKNAEAGNVSGYASVINPKSAHDDLYFSAEPTASAILQVLNLRQP